MDDLRPLINLQSKRINIVPFFSSILQYALIFFIVAEVSSGEEVKKESRNKKDINEVVSATTPGKFCYGYYS